MSNDDKPGVAVTAVECTECGAKVYCEMDQAARYLNRQETLTCEDHD